MNYMTAKQAAEKWGITANRITILCKSGRIPGVLQLGAQWMIPDDADKPADGRTRQAKKEPEKPFFRFPLYVNFEEKDFVPPLSQEEAVLRRAQKDFYACEFERARGVFETLSDHAGSIYIKICATFFMCILCAAYDTAISWKQYHYRLELLLSGDFPRRQEMALFLPLLDFFFGRFMNISEKLPCDPAYDLHPSAWYLNAFLSVYCYMDVSKENSIKTTEPFETLCRLMEQDGHYLEAQELHTILCIGCFYAKDHRAMQYHLRKSLDIAYSHNFLFRIADLEYYYSKAIDDVLSEYPAAFVEKIKNNSQSIYGSFARFSEVAEITSLYAKLTREDCLFVFYAFNGYSNKEVAADMNISERTVVNRYNAIYDKFGVAGKTELVGLVQSAMGENRK